MYTRLLLLLTTLIVGALVPAAQGGPTPAASSDNHGAASAEMVRGRVTDAETGESLPGVNVVLQGTALGTATDGRGRYELELPSQGADTLLFSYVGYDTRKVAIAGREVIDVTLQPATYMGDDVVVIGYGTMRKSDLTGSVSSLQVEDFNKGVSSSVDELLNGKIAGVQVVQSSGEPGGGAAVSIRGASSISAGTSPLYVVDGVPLDNGAAVTETGAGFVFNRSPRNPLSTINPSDIKSIEVLKDASATAIYGSRGANGVILITTKGGKPGRLTIDYDGYAGVQQPVNTIDLLTPQEYQQVLNAIIDEGGGNPEERITEIHGAGTNWQEEVFNRGAVVHSHNLAFSGGSEETNYYVSLGGFFQDGVVISSGFNRYSGRINLNHKVADQLNLDFNLSTSYSEDDYVPAGYDINEGSGALYAAYNFDPTLPRQDADGVYTVSNFHSIDNPLALAHGELSSAERFRTFGTVSGEYFVLPSLTAKLRVGFDVVDERRDTYITRLTLAGLGNGGMATILDGQRNNYLIEGTSTYNRSFGIHSVNVLTGATLQQFGVSRTVSSGRNFPSDAIGTDNLQLGDPTLAENRSFRESNQLLSYIGRVNYSLLDRYLLTATMRIDGSSRFGVNDRFGYFPSVAAAWKVGQEGFAEQWDVLSTLKLRASWGRTGNQEIGNYQALSTFSPGPTAIYDGQAVSTISPDRLANPDLRWETTEQLDVGLDFGFLDDRIHGGMDYYRKDTYDMLLFLPVPTSTGFRTQLRNIGSIANEGFEFALSSRNLVGTFSWSTDANLATLSNKVEDLGPISEIVTGTAGFTNQISIIKPGLPLNTYYGYEILGVWQEGDDLSQTSDDVRPGDLRYRDVNGDGTVNADDRVYLGDAFPDLTWSLGNTFSYKGAELYVFVQGVQGIHTLNNNLVDTYFPVNLRRNKFAEPYLNRWTPENPSDTYPSFVRPHAQGGKAVNSYTVQDASYVRLQTVRLSYRVPYESTMYRSLTIYGTAENLYTITGYDGLDPAVNSNGNANFRIDYNTYPTATTFTLGLRLGL